MVTLMFTTACPLALDASVVVEAVPGNLLTPTRDVMRMGSA